MSALEVLYCVFWSESVTRLRFSPWSYSVGVVLLSIVSILVVEQVYSFRMDYSHLQALKQDEANYEVTWGQLLLEQSALTQPSRLEQAAVNRLHMHAPTKDEIVIVKP